MKDYIVLFSETFLWYNKSEGLFYNSKEKKVFKFICNDLIYTFCVLFNDPINLYSVNIDNADKNDLMFSFWIDQILKYKFGVIYSIGPEDKKPISFPPILNLSNEIEESQLDKSRYFSSINIAECMNEISFFLVGGGLSEEESYYYKQILYPFNKPLVLEFDRIRSFLERSNTIHLQQVNLICSDRLIYPAFKDLISLLDSLGLSVTCYVQAKRTDVLLAIIECLKDTSFSLKLYFSSLADFKKTQNSLKDSNINYNWIFLIKDIDDFLFFEKLTEKHNLMKTDILPVLTRNNLNFFKDNIFLSLEDFKSISYTKQNIFCNQVINSNYWGHLYILPDGNAYGNLNKNLLGNLDVDDAIELIRREIYDPNSSWKCTREKVMPCMECIYRNLCPPPSNYEFYLNKFNLCTIDE